MVGNNARGRISKRVFQENKTRQIFQKTIISYPIWFSDDFRGYGSQLIRLYSLNVRSEIWGPSLSIQKQLQKHQTNVQQVPEVKFNF